MKNFRAVFIAAIAAILMCLGLVAAFGAPKPPSPTPTPTPTPTVAPYTLGYEVVTKNYASPGSADGKFGVTVDCPEGKVPVGRGLDGLLQSSSGIPNDPDGYVFYPHRAGLVKDSPTATGWEFAWDSSGSHAVTENPEYVKATVRVICVND